MICTVFAIDQCRGILSDECAESSYGTPILFLDRPSGEEGDYPKAGLPYAAPITPMQAAELGIELHPAVASAEGASYEEAMQFVARFNEMGEPVREEQRAASQARIAEYERKEAEGYGWLDDSSIQ